MFLQKGIPRYTFFCKKGVPSGGVRPPFRRLACRQEGAGDRARLHRARTPRLGYRSPETIQTNKGGRSPVECDPPRSYCVVQTRRRVKVKPPAAVGCAEP